VRGRTPIGGGGTRQGVGCAACEDGGIGRRAVAAHTPVPAVGRRRGRRVGFIVTRGQNGVGRHTGIVAVVAPGCGLHYARKNIRGNLDLVDFDQDIDKPVEESSGAMREGERGKESPGHLVGYLAVKQEQDDEELPTPS